MIIQVIAAFAAIFTFAMALEIPKKYLINCGFIGAAGCFILRKIKSSEGVFQIPFSVLWHMVYWKE